MLESYKWQGLGWMGWKSLQALILRAPLCGANKGQPEVMKDNGADYEADDCYGGEREKNGEVKHAQAALAFLI